jgi:S-DNA-T family DNA segregation ATPase FtsK/SpoIIIE
MTAVDTGSAERLSLRLSIAGDQRGADLIVDARPSDTVGELADQAAERVGDPLGRSLWCERRGVALERAMPLTRAGIRWGDRLRIVPAPLEPTRVGGTPKVELVVTGGPRSGEAWTLGDGLFQLGRDLANDIAIADPSLSRRHAAITVANGTVTVTDLASSNGVAVDGAALAPNQPHVLRPTDEVELGRTLIRLRPLAGSHGPDLTEHGGRVQFNRQPRVRSRAEPFRRELSAPPTAGPKARLPLLASLGPLLAGVVMFILFKSPFFLIMCGLSPVMALVTYLGDRRGRSQSFGRGSSQFRAGVDAAASELDVALDAEVAQRRLESPDNPTLFAACREVDARVWERRPTDPDFLSLRIGVADLPARAEILIADGGDEALREYAEQTLSTRRTVHAVPLTVGLAQAGVLGLAGPRTVTAGVARGLVLQAACLHAPGDVAIVAALGERADGDWEWLKWLPHLGGIELGIGRACAVGRTQAEEMLAEVRDLVADRRAQARPGAATSRRVTLLVLIDEDTGVDRALVTASLAGAAEFGVVAIWVGREVRNLPGQTGSIVEAADGRAVVTVTDVAAGQALQDVSVDGVDLDLAETAARALAPIRDVSELARGGDIPSRVSLLELLDLSPMTPEALQARWQRWRGSLGAPVGVGIDGPIRLDLLSEGPHALIAGTTGSGKSELLRSFIASCAASVPPDRLTFMLVDYKGGSAFAPCAGLPHVVNVMSDLDEHLAERALISLDAELKRRERILAQHGAKDLNELTHRAPEIAPPLLVIAVDEFAKLRDEVPEFVDGVVDIAQRGRSLGVHMVLAAQSLRNAFTPAIRANTNLRVALRVADDTESEDVIASPAAARIPSGKRHLGRAFARTGHGELREFQTAYVSGRTIVQDDRGLGLEPFSTTTAATVGVRGDRPDSDTDNDLTALATASVDAQNALGLKTPRPPWLPPLDEILDLARLQPQTPVAGQVIIGTIDLPHRQARQPLILDLAAAGHVAVYGAGRSGKTTVLTSTALSLATLAAAERVTAYGIDGASGDLSGIVELPWCAGVARVDDEELVDRMLQRFVQRIEARSGAEVRGPAETGTERYVLLIDDFSAFVQQYDKPGLRAYGNLGRILANGRAAGVHVVLTASRRAAVPSSLATHIGQRLILRMPGEEDLLSLGLDVKKVRGAQLPPGRGFTQDSLEFQIAVPVADGRVLPAGEAGPAAVSLARAATRLERLPARVALADLPPGTALSALPIGLADTDLAVAKADLTDANLLVIGPYRSGRSTALATLARAARQAVPQTRMHLISSRRGPLPQLGLWQSVASSAESATELAADLLAAIGDDQGEHATILFVDDAVEFAEPTFVNAMLRLVRAARDGGMTIVAGVDRTGARGVLAPWVGELRKDGHGILLQPDLLADGELLSAPLPRRVAAPLVPGRGFLVARGTATLVQVAC